MSSPRAETSTNTSLLHSILDPFRDVWLAGRARLAILAATGAAAGEVSVESYHGSVMLAGDVRSAAIGDEIERTVRALPGVAGVSNRIRVHAAGDGRDGRSDEDVRAAVARRLAAARELRGSRIRVEAVYDGVVTLGGTARGPRAQLAAFEIAVHTPGVRRVVSDITRTPATTAVGTRAADAA